MGLAGPDFFFYDLADFVFGKKSGTMLHEERTGTFLKNLFLFMQDLKGEKLEIATAYVAGFLCHYEIDCFTHPYIYAVIGEKSGMKGSGRHFEMEAAFDVYASVSMLGRLPSKVQQSRILSLKKKEASVVAELFTKAYGETYGDRERKKIFGRIGKGSKYGFKKWEWKRAYLSSMVAVTCLHDKAGKREKCLRPIEKMVLGFPFVSPLFCNDYTYNLTISDWAEYRNLCENGMLETCKVLETFSNWLESGEAVDFLLLLEKVGNKSYHTGREIGVPNRQ